MMANAILDSQLAVIQPSGHINAANATEFQRQLTAAVAAKHSAVVLVDMHQVESLDSAGLMAFVSALSLAHTLNRRFGICCAPPAVRMIFELTQLDGAFEIYENREAFTATIEEPVPQILK